MNIAIIGYGKMGKEIEKIVQERGHTISVRIDKDDKSLFDDDRFKNSDVAIEFTQPEFAVNNYKRCFQNQIPVVSGTTGWLSKMQEVETLCNETNNTFFYASNFSIGVNVFFELNKKLADLLGTNSDYDVEMEEIHHIQKLDAPSGTAISLAEQILKRTELKQNWSLESGTKKNLKISALRIDKVPGTHTITYTSAVDEISIKHEAKSRKGFALGAVLAAEFIKDKKGVLNMHDMLQF